MNQADYKYIDILNDILTYGETVNGRNGRVRRIEDVIVKFDSTPLVSVRKTAWKQALREMEWFLSGSVNINDLHPSVHNWWKAWADEYGFVNNSYGQQFRHFVGEYGEVDQIDYLISNIKKSPESRRHVITTWNTADMISSSTPITNCHGSLIKATVSKGHLNLSMHQRSADMILGVPHNWIQYQALLLYLAKQTDMEPGRFTWIGGDCHIYEAHIDTMRDILDEAQDDLFDYARPDIELIYTPTSDIFKASDFSLDQEYRPLTNKKLKLIV